MRTSSLRILNEFLESIIGVMEKLTNYLVKDMKKQVFNQNPI